MKQFDVVLGLLIGFLPILVSILLIVHPQLYFSNPLLWFVALAALVAFYGPIMSSIVWRVARRERQRESELNERSVEAFLEAVKSRYGAPAAKYISKQKWSIPQAIDFLREREEEARKQSLARSINEKKVA